MPTPQDIRLPARSPRELLEFVGFVEQLNTRMRDLRESSPLPRQAVTLPDEFDDVALWLLGHIRSQAERADATGESIVEVRLPRTEHVASLARWAEPRMDLLAGLTRAGLVQPEWERPLKLTVEVLESVLSQIGDERPGA